MTLTARRGGMALTAQIVPMGEDLCVALTGGERPHLGSAALGTPHPAISRGGPPSATVSVLNVTGHRDGVLAERMCKRLSAALGRQVAVVCGVHADGLDAGGISAALECAEDLTGRILEALERLESGLRGRMEAEE